MPLRLLMRTSQGLGVLEASQEPPGPPPDAQPRVADRSHAHNIPAPTHLQHFSPNAEHTAKAMLVCREFARRRMLILVYALAEH